MFLPRLLSTVVAETVSDFPAVVLTGPRQSGKTTLLRTSQPEAAYVSFDDPLQQAFAREDPRGLLSGLGDRPAILDEVQHVPELLPYLKLAIDADRGRTGRFLLTGSQQFPLMAGVTESLAGRVALLELLPLSWPELQARGADWTLAEVLWRGGYPEPALHTRRRDLWVRAYLATYLERDVRQLANVTNLRAFGQLLALAAARHGAELNRADLARDCGVSQPTVHAWMGVMEASYVLTLLPPYLENLGKRVVRSPKVYFTDSALVCELTRQPGAEAALAGALGGLLLEGWVVNEARKAFTHRGLRPAIWFWRSNDGLEVDLMLEAGGRVHLVEVKSTATPTERHSAPLQRLGGLLGERVGERLVVCRVEAETRLPGGAVAIPWSAFPARCAALMGT